MDAPDEPGPAESVIAAQSASHSENWDYEWASPHLRHVSLRSMIEQRLRRLVAAGLARSESCRVLDVGAGHGTFTRCLVDAGASVTVTEASMASVDHLRQEFGDRVDVRHDATGEDILSSGEQWDIVVMAAVLHHIPDYLGFLERVVPLISAEGALFTVADPLYYPRMPRTTRILNWGSYFAWRVFQGDYGRGLATRVRRLRGNYDDSQPSDIVEYHVIRDGVDEVATSVLLKRHFADVEVFRYWSTQSALLQRAGDRTARATDFGIEATGRTSGGAD